MQQRLIWMLFTISGINLLLPSCGKKSVEYRVKGEFRYGNNTSREIRIVIRGAMNGAPLREYSLPAGDTLTLFTDGETHSKTASPQDYRPAISGDTTTVLWDDTLCYSEYNHTGPLLQHIDAYTAQRRGDRDYLFYYIIGNDLLGAAVKCP